MIERPFHLSLRGGAEHTAVLQPPDRFASLHRKADLLAEGVHTVFGVADGVADIQALSFDAAAFTAAQAQAWLQERGFVPLEFVEAPRFPEAQTSIHPPRDTTMDREFRVEKAGLAGLNWITVCRAGEVKARQIYQRQLRVYSVGRFRLLDADGNVVEEGKAVPLFSAN